MSKHKHRGRLTGVRRFTRQPRGDDVLQIELGATHPGRPKAFGPNGPGARLKRRLQSGGARRG